MHSKTISQYHNLEIRSQRVGCICSHPIIDVNCSDLSVQAAATSIKGRGGRRHLEHYSPTTYNITGPTKYWGWRGLSGLRVSVLNGQTRVRTSPWTRAVLDQSLPQEWPAYIKRSSARASAYISPHGSMIVTLSHTMAVTRSSLIKRQKAPTKKAAGRGPTKKAVKPRVTTARQLARQVAEIRAVTAAKQAERQTEMRFTAWLDHIMVAASSGPIEEEDNTMPSDMLNLLSCWDVVNGF